MINVPDQRPFYKLPNHHRAYDPDNFSMKKTQAICYFLKWGCFRGGTISDSFRRLVRDLEQCADHFSVSNSEKSKCFLNTFEHSYRYFFLDYVHPMIPFPYMVNHIQPEYYSPALQETI